MESVLMLDVDLEGCIIRFIARKTGLQIEEVTPSSRLLHDLQTDGDDAEELLTEYSEAFKVDLTGFNFGSHFRSEPNIFNDLVGEIDHLVPITVAQLVQAAHVHRWLGASDTHSPSEP